METVQWIGLLAVMALSCYTILPVDGFTRGTEEELRNRLLKDYNNEVRPDPVTKVFMLFHVTSIAAVDIRNEIFSLSGWWSMRWYDDRLEWTDYPEIPVVQFREDRVWTPVIVVSNSWYDDRLEWTDYPEIPVVQFREDRVWTPVIVVSNSIDDLASVGESSIPLRVDRNGTVTWSPPGLIKVSCTMDISYFPFDTQICGIEVTSFGYTIREMDVQLFQDGLTFRYYSTSGEWDIVDIDSKRTEYEEDGYRYARVTFYMSLKRKPLYYGLNMLLPVIVCSVLTLFVFLLPPESGEKIGYCLTVLLAFMVILTLVAQDLPTTASSTSILEIYIAVVLIMGGLSVVLSIAILHIFFLPEDKPVGDCTDRLIRFFIMFCCLDGCCNSHRQRVDPGIEYDPRFNGKHNDANSVLVYSGSLDDPLGRSWRHEAPPQGDKDGTSLTGRPDSRTYHNEIPRPRLVKQQSGLGAFRPQSPHDTSREAPGSEITMTWQLVSRTLDTVLFRTYLVFLVISSVVFVCVLALN